MKNILQYLEKTVRQVPYNLFLAEEQGAMTSREVYDQARALLNELMEDSVRETMALAGSLAREIGGEIAARGGAYGPRKEFLEAYCGRVAMPLFSGA